MKKMIGYTTGVFDMFHIGHLNILKQAKEHCDYLIVGVSTDDLVISYKHKKPIIPFEDRIAIVSAIKYVDMAVPQIDRNKISAYEKWHFDKMFVGDDWKGNQLFNSLEPILSGFGVEIVYFEYTPNISSSLLRNIVENENNPHPNI
jgi:glycerol-3-phosphate cytidylyltransferase